MTWQRTSANMVSISMECAITKDKYTRASLWPWRCRTSSQLRALTTAGVLMMLHEEEHQEGFNVSATERSIKC